MNATLPTELLSLDNDRRLQDRNKSARYSPARTSGTPSKQVAQETQADKPVKMRLSSRGYTCCVGLTSASLQCSFLDLSKDGSSVCVCVFSLDSENWLPLDRLFRAGSRTSPGVTTTGGPLTMEVPLGMWLEIRITQSSFCTGIC